jgi:7-cyano-7-deazaguanine synthase
MTHVLLSSGGLDSGVLAAMNPGAIHLTVDYGQRHIVEIEHAQRVAEFYGAEHLTVRCPVAAFGGSVLSGDDGALAGTSTVVPNRNAVFISLAASLAEARGGGTVLIGCNADDHADYPDCRPEFISALGEAIQLATSGRVFVAAPLLHIDKPGIGALAREFDLPVHLTWSCYAGGRKPCLTCGACIQRERALGVLNH